MNSKSIKLDLNKDYYFDLENLSDIIYMIAGSKNSLSSIEEKYNLLKPMEKEFVSVHLKRIVESVYKIDETLSNRFNAEN